MAQFAYFETEPAPAERRNSPRKKLHLTVRSATAPVDQTQVIVHDISATGLLLESPLELLQGEEIDVDLPQHGARRLTVAWASGRFFGCQFAEVLPADAACGAKLTGMDAIPKKGSPEAVSLAAVQLHELRMAIERISRVLDRAMDQLSKRER